MSKHEAGSSKMKKKEGKENVLPRGGAAKGMPKNFAMRTPKKSMDSILTLPLTDPRSVFTVRKSPSSDLSASRGLT